MATSGLSALVALSTFKGTLSNVEACQTVGSALQKLDIPHEIFPIGDGGRGTLDAIHKGLASELVTFESTGPLGDKVTARVLCLPDATAPQAIYIESADTCGYHLTLREGREAMRATSYGLGKAIDQAVKRWEHSLTTVYVGLGDSAVSDMGMGMLCALGFKFLDAGGRVLWGNADGLRQMRTIQLPHLSVLDRVRFTVLCDVVNPLLGPKGSARTFARQKGASTTQISLIEQGMDNFARLIHEINGRQLREEPLTGAAGGLAAAFLAFFTTELVLGARFLLDWLHFEEKAGRHTFIVTGEGRTDQQTLNGKAPQVCLERAERMGKKSVLLSGVLGDGYAALLHNPLLKGCFECGDKPTPQEALRNKAEEVFSSEELRETLRG